MPATAARIAVVALVAGVILAIPTAARASCAELPPITDGMAAAPAVFIGTVVAVEGDGRLATVAVDEIWKGDVPATATVRGAETIEPGVFTSVDRTYEDGARYLFVPRSMAGDQFADDGCTHTQIYTSDLDTLRPADARTVTPPPAADGGGSDWVVPVLIAAGLAAAGGVVFGAVRLRRARHPQVAR